MRKLLWLALLMAVPGWGLDQFSGWCETGNKKVAVSGLTSSTIVQQSYPNTSTPSTSCKITVYTHGVSSPLPTIYSDNNGTPTPLANPFYVNTDGSYQFFAAEDRYDVVGTVGATTIFTISNLSLFDPADATSINVQNLTVKKLNTIAFAEEYANLQAAISDVCDAVHQGLVYFKGTFTELVAVPSHCTLDGLNRGTIKVPDNTNATYAVTASSASDIHLRNFIIDGNKANQHPSGAQRTGGITFTAVTDFDIEHLSITNPYNHGVQILDGSARFKIDHNTIHDNTNGSGIIIGTGTLTTGISDFNVDNNNIYNITAANCIFTTGPIGSGFGVSRGTVNSNVCNSPGDIGIEVGVGSQQITTDSNTISGVANGKTGILIRGAKNVPVVGNTVTGTTSSTGIGIYVFTDIVGTPPADPDATVFNTVTVGNNTVRDFTAGSGIAWSTNSASAQNLGIVGNTVINTSVPFDQKTAVTGLYRSGNSDGVYVSTSNFDFTPAAGKFVRLARPLSISGGLVDVPSGTTFYVFTGGNPQDIKIEANADTSTGVGFKNTVQNWALSLRSDLSEAMALRNITTSLDSFIFATNGDFTALGKGTFTGISTGTAGSATHAVCWKTATTIGYCSTQPNGSGVCTCN